MRMPSWSFFLILLFLISCRVGPNYTRPSQNIPKTFITASDSKTNQTFVLNKQISKQWWRVFNCKTLNQLIALSFEHNPDVKAAQATLLAAQEEVYAHQGIYFPFVGLSASPSKQQVAKILTSVLASDQYNYALFTGQVFVSYMPDVFGGNKRKEEALIAETHFRQLQLEAIYLTLASNIAITVVQEAALRAQIKTTQQMIQNNTKLIHLTNQRHHLGDATQYEANSMEIALIESRAKLPLLKKQLAAQRNLLHILLGQYPQEKKLPKFTLNDLHLPQELPISLPATLLEHRPDIRAAEEKMRAANALIGVAVANRLPNISLGFTNAGSTSTNLGTLFNPETMFWSLVGIFTQPIYDAGTLKHRQKVAEAIYTEAAAQYRSTIIQAFQNVTDTLNAIRLDNQAYQMAKAVEKKVEKNLSIAQQQWHIGDLSTPELLNNRQRYQQAKLNLIQAQANRLLDSVALFQALGGSWWVKKDTVI